MVSDSSGGPEAGSADNCDVQLKKGPWTAAEDAVLVEYVKKHGEGNWNAVQKQCGLARCGKSCRLRWANHLRPNLKKGAFSPEEERLIVELHAKHGNKWARMASMLPGRTDNEIKNYWNTRVKRHQRHGLPLYPPEIQPQRSLSPHHHRSHSSPASAASCFSFHSQIPCSTSVSHHPLHASMAANSSLPSLPSPTSLSYSTHNSISSPSTPTNPNTSLGYQAQFPSPSTNSCVPVCAALALLSPLSSPLTAVTPSSFLPLPPFDFSIARTPLILEAPPHFKRFSSKIISDSNRNSLLSPNCPATHFPLPFAQFSRGSTSNASPIGESFTHDVGSLLSRSNSEFQDEMQKENQELCSLYMAVRQPEFPSNQLLLPPPQDSISEINFAASNTRFDKRLSKKISSIDTNAKLEVFESRNELLEDLLQEARMLATNEQSPIKQNSLISIEHKANSLVYQHFSDLSDHSSSFPSSSGLEGRIEAGKSVVETSSAHAELYGNGGDGRSSIVKEENIGLEVHMGSMVHDTQDYDGTDDGSCSWDHLPMIS